MSSAQRYKETKVGEIPENWEVVSFTKVADFLNGYGFKTSDWRPEGLPIVRIQNLNDPNAEFNYFDGTVDDKYYLENGDLLLSWSASLGIYIWNRGKAVLNQHIFKIIPKSGIDKDYLYYVSYKAIEDLKKRIHGSTMRHFKKRELDATFIPLPPLVEQRGISRILSSVDEAIRKTDRVIEKTEMLKLGLMQRLFRRGIEHTDFKQTDLGEIPEEWRVKELKAISLNGTQNGLYKKAQDFGSGCKFVRMTELFRSDILIIDEMKRVRVSTSELEKYRLNQGDLLFARRSLKVEGAGKCVLVPAVHEPVLFESSIIRVALKQEIAYPRFYLYYFNSPSGRQQMRRLIRTVAVSGITGTDLQKIKLPVPPIKEQNEISSILSVVDEKIMLENQRKKKLEELKKGLMQVLITGKVRVKVD